MVEALLASDGTPRALVLTGGPGVGKTSLWEAGVEAATGRGLRVLRASGSGAETQLSFAALSAIPAVTGAVSRHFWALT